MKKIHKQQEPYIIKKYLEEGETASSVAKLYNVSHHTVNRVLERNKISKKSHSLVHRKYKLNEQYFNKIDSEEKAYFLGFLYADGCNEKNGNITIALQKSDSEILKKFKELLESTKPLRTIPPRGKGKQFISTLNVTSQIISQDLSKLGCVYRKSLVLEFPNQNQVPNHLLKHFIRGMFDGDGNIYLSKRNQLRISITTTNNFCNTLKERLKNVLGINCYISNYKTSSVTKKISSHGNITCSKFLDWIYKDSKIRLKRKYNQYLEFKEKYGEIHV